MHLDRPTLKNALGAVLIVAALFLAVAMAFPAAIGAADSHAVLSGSMEPTISAGDLVVVRGTDPADIEAGDVITFTQNGERITHRVVEVRTGENGRQFVTKGDANENRDPEAVPAAQLEGKVWFHLPLLGHLVVFAGSRLGTVALVVVPGVLLVLSELYDLLTEATTDEGGGE